MTVNKFGSWQESMGSVKHLNFNYHRRDAETQRFLEIDLLIVLFQLSELEH